MTGRARGPPRPDIPDYRTILGRGKSMTEQTKGRAACAVPGCGRPASRAESVWPCAEHMAVYDARAEEEAWGLAGNILRSWVESTRGIGSDELTEVMEKALGEVEDRVNAALDKIERAEEALR